MTFDGNRAGKIPTKLPTLDSKSEPESSINPVMARNGRPEIRPVWFAPLLALLALAAVGMVLYSSRLGPGLTDDSYFYIQPARAFAAGEGLHLSGFFTPLLPVLLVPPTLLGVDGQVFLRLFNAAMFGLVVLFSGLAVLRISASPAFALSAAGLVLASENLLNIFPYAASEALYLALMLAAFLALERTLRTGNRTWFAWAVVLSALAALARYMGVMLVGAGAATLLLWGKQPVMQRLRKAAWFGFLSILPLASYVLYNQLASGSLFGPRGYAAGAWQDRFIPGMLAALLNWFLPGRIIAGREYLLAGAVAGALVLAILWVLLKRRDRMRRALQENQPSALYLALGAFALLNLAFLFSLLFTSGIIGVAEAYSGRYLAPVYLAVLILAASGLSLLWRAGAFPERAAISVLAVALALTFAYRAQDAVRTLAKDGMGYNTARWHESETVRYLNNHPEVPLVSTGNYGLYFWTGRLPRSISEFHTKIDLQTYLQQEKGWLVVIYSMPAEMYGWQTAELLDGMTLVQEFSEGAVYQPGP